MTAEYRTTAALGVVLLVALILSHIAEITAFGFPPTEGMLILETASVAFLVGTFAYVLGQRVP